MIKYSKYTGNKRDQYMRLFLIGDEDESKVREYINQGCLFLAEQSNTAVAVAIVVPTSDGNVGELKNIAVDAKAQGQGIGSKMIAYVFEQARDRYNTILVGTGDADVQNILFYLKNGFRFSGIKKDFFDEYKEQIISNGVVLKDMVLLTKKL
ncbi:GNAT family N-acetyltransferase [Lactiplantibacillus plantarum]|uniref:GNAT family N-acetyltransferase n=1 Tax=Lactiplantibacillus TaxID=2767842 RepID=UPI000CA13496|nr:MULTISPECIES: GNAT family N-acetyltransferase [Lactiplantibacillus]AUH37903.1 N-acetyltransferase [Lactiplantibacillus plantarum]MCH7260125.1 GNAT family N-acetyltransferase [Lactiplantibacillus sp. ME-2]MCT4439854.1 GNAT family N-acetyltransferase [Lactiplantibacillus plantarum]MDP4437735.1 GNAT family N-acetyltransferase [Lactiplantibacillus plantarum]MDP4440846.1 GNAT family N-acetyltransferase [Lactiplantibacillus plantarum]